MKLHIYIDDTHIEPSRWKEILKPLSTAMADWVNAHQQNAELLMPSTPEQAEDKTNAENTGICILIKSKYHLKEPLNFLYGLAKDYKCEFAIAMVDADSGTAEDVCYFGHEEGRPDMFEIANYLELE
jgi:hypothetical protein